MSKSRDTKKDSKKKPAQTIKEKRKAKQEKNNRSLVLNCLNMRPFGRRASR